jgi:ABC-type nitrate/sulfonate/bicarbonate transport system permease component
MQPRVVRAVVSFVILAVAWELTGRYLITGQYAFAPLSAVLVELYHQFASGAIYPHLAASGSELGLGFAAAAVFGVAMGVWIGVSQRVNEYTLPVVYAANAIPIVALAPLFIIMFGIGTFSKLLVIFLLCYFPILLNTVTGIRTIDRGLVEAGVAFGANRLQIVRMILLPNAVPFIVAGMRTALGRGLVGIIVAELYGAKAGLGWLSWYASEQMNAKLLFVAVLLLAFAGVVMTVSLDALERRIAPWRQSSFESGANS